MHRNPHPAAAAVTEPDDRRPDAWGQAAVDRRGALREAVRQWVGLRTMMAGRPWAGAGAAAAPGVLSTVLSPAAGAAASAAASAADVAAAEHPAPAAPWERDADAPPPGGYSAVLSVGPGRPHTRLASALQAAPDGALIELDPGEQAGEPLVIEGRRGLTIRARGPGLQLRADGRAAEGKALWVLRGSSVRLRGLGFSGVRVADGNGAGIRFESGALALQDCRFEDCENGLLSGNDGVSELWLRDCVFDRNGAGDGRTHHLYVGAIARLGVVGCRFGAVRVGHLLKSRARVSDVIGNRLSDDGGSASYELEFPNGGRVRAIGNLIRQGAATRNPVIVSYGAEGLQGEDHRLDLVHNTLVNERPGDDALWLRVSDGRAAAPATVAVQVLNNLLCGAGRWQLPADARRAGNVERGLDALQDPARGDWRPHAGALRDAPALAPLEPALRPPARPRAPTVAGAFNAANARP